VSNVTTSREYEVKVAKVELLDCGQASKVTKGLLIPVLYEFGWPPANRMIRL
jgi:hypothetical protein